MPRRYVICMIAGWALWVALFAMAHICKALETYAPEWVRESEMLNIVGSLSALAAYPVPLLGWLLIWGDGPQPPDWVEGIPFNVVVGLVLYGSLGVSACAIYDRFRKRNSAPNIPY